MIPKLIDMGKIYAVQQFQLPFHNGLNQTSPHTPFAQATVNLDPKAHIMSIQANISNVPSSTPLTIDLHQNGSCTGPIVFLLQATSDGTGHASANMTFNDQQDTTIPSNWFVNVHDITRQGINGKPLSIGCSPIQVNPSGLQGNAQLNPVPQHIAGLNQTAQSTTSGMTTLQLNPNAHTLAVEAIIFGAPPHTPLVMHIRGGGSCQGPILFPLQAISDDAGHASATMTFNDQQDSAIPNSWFFNVNNNTQKGPDGNPLSIACGPIQTIESTLAFAKLDPVQLPTPSSPASSIPVPSTTQNTTEGITTVQLDPSAHTLAIQAVTFGAPPNTPLVMHVHGDGSCTGSTLYTLQATSDNVGNAFATMTFNDQQDSTIPKNWFFNVYDNTEQGPDGKPLSIACGPIQVTDSSGLTAHALLCPVQASQPTSSANPTVTPQTAKTSAPAIQNATQGLAVFYLNPTAHTLNVLEHIVGAPPKTTLAMEIHGGGSCTGPTLFMLQTTSDDAGNATAIMPFSDQQDSTLSSQLFFAVKNTAKQGPDGKPLSIACGPIEAVGQVGLAQLNLLPLLSAIS
jgi:Cu/Zn superoxide dismutase